MSGGLLDPTTQEADEEDDDDGEEEQEEEGGDLLIWGPQESPSRSSLCFSFLKQNEAQCGRQNGNRERGRERERGEGGRIVMKEVGGSSLSPSLSLCNQIL